MSLSCATGSAVEKISVCAGRKSQERNHAQISFRLSCSFLGIKSIVVSTPSRFSTLKVKAQSLNPVVASAENEIYNVELDKPYGLKFYKGADGGVYIDAIAVNSSASRLGTITEGDKVLATSAVFGDEIWPAAEYGRTMYTVKNRVGPLLVQFEKRNGIKIEPFARKDAYVAERNAGNYGDAIREKQIENYLQKKEYEVQRTVELSEGLELYKLGKYEDSLSKFQTVLILQPTDRERAVTGYNIACCYSKLNEISQGLDALEASMEAGFEDYKTIRTDPDLENLRESDKFVPLLNRYDEPFLNENALKAISGVFGFFGGKK